MPKLKEKPQAWPADKVERRKVADLIPYARNARTHSETQVSQIAASIKEWGWTTPVLIDEDGGIIAGHGRVMAAQKLGIDDVPAMTATGWTEAQKKAYVLADNQLALNAGWDMDLLKVELTELDDLDFDVDLIGFDGDFLANLLIDGNEGLTDPDEVPEAPEYPVTVLGDVWVMGNHRIICGDSTSADTVDKLLGSVKPDLLYTDPPYGIGVKGMRPNRGGATVNSKVPDFADDDINAAVDCIALVEAMGIPRQVWWGANYYCHHLPQSNNWFVWDKRVEDKHATKESDCEMAWVKSKWSSVRIFRHVWKGMIKDSEHGQKRVHATQKPVALAVWSYEYYKDVKTVLDLFTGSGSALIACEQSGRQFFGAELMPAYVDVAVKRWQDFTGKEAVHEQSGKTFEEVSNGRS